MLTLDTQTEEYLQGKISTEYPLETNRLHPFECSFRLLVYLNTTTNDNIKHTYLGQKTKSLILELILSQIIFYISGTGFVIYHKHNDTKSI